MTSQRIEKLQTMLKAEPNDAFCLYALAQEYDKIGDAENAIDHFDRTLAVNPGELYAYYHKARVLAAQDRVDEARATIESGFKQARSAGDDHAVSELSELLASLESH